MLLYSLTVSCFPMSFLIPYFSSSAGKSSPVSPFVLSQGVSISVSISEKFTQVNCVFCPLIMMSCLSFSYCPVDNPCWAELLHFTSFLNQQLISTERSIFCNAAVMGQDLPGFKSFTVRFLIRMAKDFSTRSVEITDESQGFCK